MKALKSQKFKWTVDQTRNKTLNNVAASEIQVQPIRIYAWKTEDEIILNQDQTQNEEDLVNLLVSRAKQYGGIVESLGEKSVRNPG